MIIYENKKEVPPCEDCWPTVFDENEDAVKIFLKSYTQIRYDPKGQPIGIDLNVPLRLIELYEVNDKEECLDKIIMLVNHFNKE